MRFEVVFLRDPKEKPLEAGVSVDVFLLHAVFCSASKAAITWFLKSITIFDSSASLKQSFKIDLSGAKEKRKLERNINK